MESRYDADEIAETNSPTRGPDDSRKFILLPGSGSLLMDTYIIIHVSVQEEEAMKQTLQRKNYRLNTAKLRRAQKELGTRTETETIHVALDLATNC